MRNAFQNSPVKANPTGRAERGPALQSLAKEDWNDLDRTV